MTEGFKSTGEYVASEQLMASVNVAIALQKPLLIKGEPGTGKTMIVKTIIEIIQEIFFLYKTTLICR